MEVTWSRHARTRLQAIRRHIARDNPAAANRLIEFILHQGGELAHFPRRGRVVPEVSQPDVRELIVKGYRVLYEITDESIEILTVFEGHRLLRDEELEE